MSLSNIPALVSVCSIMVALIGIIVSNLMARRNSRTQHTLVFLMKSLEVLSLRDAIEFLDEFVRGVRDMPDPLTIEINDPEAFKKIRHALNYYEYICAASNMGDIDARMLNRIRGGAIRRMFGKMEFYINGIREKHGKFIYVEIEKFVKNFLNDFPNS